MNHNYFSCINVLSTTSTCSTLAYFTLAFLVSEMLIRHLKSALFDALNWRAVLILFVYHLTVIQLAILKFPALFYMKLIILMCHDFYSDFLLTLFVFLCL
jgi:hypothetical protein